MLNSHNRSTKSQVYTLMFGSQKIPVYCHMGNFGCGDGGWTLAMKIDGTKVGISPVLIILCLY